MAQLNGSVDLLRPQRVSKAGPPSDVAAAMRRFGSAIGEEAEAVAALSLEAPTLVAERDAYVAAARRSSAAAKAWADALDAKVGAHNEAEGAKSALDANLDELDERCEASVCFELMQRLARPTVAPEHLDALVDDLARTTTGVDEIDAAIARHRRQVERLATSLRAMRQAEAEVSRQRDALTEAAAAEDPVVARINRLCRP